MTVKFMTSAKNSGGCLILALLMICSAQVWADTATASSSLSAEEIKAAKDACKGKTNESECVFQKMKELRGGGSSSSGGTCDFSKWNEAVSEFTTSCSAAGQSSSGPAGTVACSDTLKQCDSSSSNGAEAESDRSTSELDSSSPSSSDSSTRPLYNMDAKKTQFDICPVMATKDFEKFQKEVEDAQKDVDDLQKEIPDLEQGLADVETTLADEMSSLQEEKTNAESEYAQQKKELDRTKKEKIKALEEKIAGMQNEILQLEAAIKTAELSKQGETLKKNEALMQIDITCMNSATLEVSKRRAALYELARAGQLNRGNFLSALGNVGLTDRQADQRLAETLTKQCQNRPDTLKLKKYAEDILAQRLKEIDGQIDAMRTQISSKKTEMARVKNQSGPCTQASQAEDCQALTEYVQDRYDLDKQAAGRAQAIQTKYMNAQNKAYRDKAVKQKALAMAAERMERQKNYLDQKRELMGLMQDKNGGTSLSAEDYGKLWMNFSKLKERAGTLNTCCVQGNTSDQCTNIGLFYDSIYGDGGYKPESAAPPTPPQRPPPCRGPNCGGGATAAPSTN